MNTFEQKGQYCEYSVFAQLSSVLVYRRRRCSPLSSPQAFPIFPSCPWLCLSSRPAAIPACSVVVVLTNSSSCTLNAGSGSNLLLPPAFSAADSALPFRTCLCNSHQLILISGSGSAALQYTGGITAHVITTVTTHTHTHRGFIACARLLQL